MKSYPSTVQDIVYTSRGQSGVALRITKGRRATSDIQKPIRGHGEQETERARSLQTLIIAYDFG